MGPPASPSNASLFFTVLVLARHAWGVWGGYKTGWRRQASCACHAHETVQHRAFRFVSFRFASFRAGQHLIEHPGLDKLSFTGSGSSAPTEHPQNKKRIDLFSLLTGILKWTFILSVVIGVCSITPTYVPAHPNTVAGLLFQKVLAALFWSLPLKALVEVARFLFSLARACTTLAFLDIECKRHHGDIGSTGSSYRASSSKKNHTRH